jgi:hypothetical protein
MLSAKPIDCCINHCIVQPQALLSKPLTYILLQTARQTAASGKAE